MTRWPFSTMKDGETVRIPAADARLAKQAAKTHGSRNFIGFHFATDPETGDLLVRHQTPAEVFAKTPAGRAAQQAEYMKDPIYRLLVGV